MSKSDHKFVNFSEDYELTYIANQYEESEKVKKELQKIGQEKSSKNLTHEEVYQMLDKLGYKKIKK